MPAPSAPLAEPLPSQRLSLITQFAGPRMPQPREPCTVQRSTVLPLFTKMPMPVRAVAAAVEFVLLTAHCETSDSRPVMIPAELDVLLVFERKLQPMTVPALLVRMPALPPFASAA